MSYMREGEPLRCFKGEGDAYIVGTAKGGKPFVEDYGALYEDAVSLADLMARMVMRETGDEDFTNKVVRSLAVKMGIEDYLLPQCRFSNAEKN
jgi:hypothetical protein